MQRKANITGSAIRRSISPGSKIKAPDRYVAIRYILVDVDRLFIGE